MVIERMRVGSLRHLVERAYRESAHLQFLRELVRNSIEAGATSIEIGPDRETAKTTGVWRFMCSDNGRGMEPDQMGAYLNTFGGGGKPIGDAHENYGVGSKTSLLPWNKFGVVVISYTAKHPKGNMVWLCFEDGEYGARALAPGGGPVEPFKGDLVDWSSIKPPGPGISGTVVVLMGDTGTEDTYMFKEGPKQHSVFYASTYLNSRFWTIPEGIEIKAWAFQSKLKRRWNPDSTSKHRTGGGHRGVEGASHFLEEGFERGELSLDDGTRVLWALEEEELGRARSSHQGQTVGFIAALYHGELYDIRSHHKQYSAMGIRYKTLRPRVTVIFEPPTLEGGQGVYPDTARTSLRVMGTAMAGKPLPWSDWYVEFEEKMPEAIREELRKQVRESSALKFDNTWRDKLNAMFGSRWSQLVLFTCEDGSEMGERPDRELVDPVEEDADVEEQIEDDPKQERESSERQLTLVGVKSGRRRGMSVFKSLAGLPEIEWQPEIEFGVPTYAVEFHRPTRSFPAGLVMLNEDHHIFTEVEHHWTSKLGARREDEQATIREVVRNVYAQNIVARVAHVHAMRATWDMATFLTPEALTLSCYGLLAEHGEIERMMVEAFGAAARKGA
jgi:hypothetical protein